MGGKARQLRLAKHATIYMPIFSLVEMSKDEAHKEA
jgi:hypothetical protein